MTGSRNVQYVGMHMSHHATLSGYDQLANLRPGELLESRDDEPAGIGLKLLRPMVQRSGNFWYNRNSLRAELRVHKKLMTGRDELVHLLYGENTYRFSGAFGFRRRSRNNRLVATYHTPPARLKELIGNKRQLTALDAVIMMSRNQTEYFASVLPEQKLHFVPHGINTDYFCPGESIPPGAPTSTENQPFRAITVGHHLRDYDVLAAVANRALQDKLNIEFVVVAREDRTAAVTGIPNVTRQSGISDEELLRLYQTSDALLLPLTEATANNSLLEGMACGLPIISSELQGVRDYAPEDVALAPVGDADRCYELVRAAVEGEVDLNAMGKASRCRAEELNWNNIRHRLDTIYQGL